MNERNKRHEPHNNKIQKQETKRQNTEKSAHLKPRKEETW
jgi:hypothetical protein